MEDRRFLIVEYKGAHIADGADTAKKQNIGELWERESGGKGLFIVTESPAGRIHSEKGDVRNIFDIGILRVFPRRRLRPTTE